MYLDWSSCEGGFPCLLFDLDLDSIVDCQGVYVIWCASDQGSQAIHVGQVSSRNRDFKDRFLEHRNDDKIKRYLRHGNVYVSWAPVEEPSKFDGIERFLYDELVPLEGHRAPNAGRIGVNLPYGLNL